MLCGLRPVSTAETRSKLHALQFAHAKWSEVEPDVDFPTFVKKTPKSLLGQIFGSAGHDFYATTLLSCIAQSDGGFDTFAAAVLNRIILQLNFQTRFIGSRGAPETFVLDGPASLFKSAMANGNAILGFKIGSDLDSTAPRWSGCSHIDLAMGALFHRPVEAIPAAMEVLGRKRIGCIGLVLEQGETGGVKDQDRYACLDAHFQPDAFFVVVGSGKRALRAASALEAAHPEARIVARIYDTDEDERRAVVVASGLARMPKLEW